MKQESDHGQKGTGKEPLRFSEAWQALPAELACDIDRMTTYLRNAQAKQLLRDRLAQGAKRPSYQDTTPPSDT